MTTSRFPVSSLTVSPGYSISDKEAKRIVSFQLNLSYKRHISNGVIHGREKRLFGADPRKRQGEKVA